MFDQTYLALNSYLIAPCTYEDSCLVCYHAKACFELVLCWFVCVLPEIPAFSDERSNVGQFRTQVHFSSLLASYPATGCKHAFVHHASRRNLECCGFAVVRRYGRGSSDQRRDLRTPRLARRTPLKAVSFVFVVLFVNSNFI